MIINIIQHEIKRTLRNSKTWYCLAVLQGLLAIIFNWLMNNFVKNQAIAQAIHYGITEEVLHPFYAWFVLLLLVMLPMLATQTLCAEKQRGTMVNYYCAPISAWQVILGKFFTLNIFFLLLLIFASTMPISIVISGALDWGQYTATLLGVFLLLTAATPFCLAISASMANVMRSNFVIFIALAGFILIEWAAQYAGRDAMFLQDFGLLKPLKHFLAGIIYLPSIAYYLFITLITLWISTISYKRRWQQ